MPASHGDIACGDDAESEPIAWHAVPPAELRRRVELLTVGGCRRLIESFGRFRPADLHPYLD